MPVERQPIGIEVRQDSYTRVLAVTGQRDVHTRRYPDPAHIKIHIQITFLVRLLLITAHSAIDRDSANPVRTADGDIKCDLHRRLVPVEGYEIGIRRDVGRLSPFEDYTVCLQYKRFLFYRLDRL